MTKKLRYLVAAVVLSATALFGQSFTITVGSSAPVAIVTKTGATSVTVVENSASPTATYTITDNNSPGTTFNLAAGQSYVFLSSPATFIAGTTVGYIQATTGSGFNFLVTQLQVPVYKGVNLTGNGGNARLPTPPSSGLCLVSNGSTTGSYAWSSCSGSASTAWSNITAGTNAAQGNLLVGAGSTVAPTSTGVVQANQTVTTGLIFPGSTSGTTALLAAAIAGSGTLTLPTGTGTVALLSTVPNAGSCTNQVVTALTNGAAPTCTGITLASAYFANQGTATTVLHGNASGNPSFGSVVLTTDVSGLLPNANLANNTIGISGTANQITSSSATPALGGSTTLAIANPFTFPGLATLAASTTGAASLNVPTGTAPTGGALVSGALWNLSGILQLYDGTHTNSLATIQGAKTSGNVPAYSGTVGLLGAGYGVQGTDPNLLTSGTISGTGSALCTDSSGGATTVSCPTGGTVTSVAQTVPSGFAVGGTPITASGTLAITYSVSGGGQVINSSASNTAGFTATPTIGVQNTAQGTLTLAGSSSSPALLVLGTSGASAFGVTLQNLSAGAAYNFNLPATAGASGQVLASQGGGSSVMTWTSSLTNPMTTIGDLIVGGTAGAAARLGAPTSPNGVVEVLTSTPSGGVGGTEAWGLPGLPVRAVTGTTSTDTVAAADCSPKRVDYQGSVAVAVTLPTATTLAVPNCVFKMANDTTGSTTAVTITPTTWTLNYQGTTGLTSLAIPQKQWCTLEPDPGGTSWDVDCATTNLGTVTGPGSSTSGDLASFNGTSGIVLQDSGVVAANVITDSGSLTTHGVVIASGAKTITSTAVGATNTLLHGNTGADPTYSGVVIADLTATGSPGSTTFLRGDNTWAVPAGTSLPSGLQGYPLINTNGSTTYATDLLCIDAAKASSGADAGIRAQNAEAAVNGNSSPCVDSRSEIGTTIPSSVNPFISTFSGKWYAPAGAFQLTNVSAVVGGSVEVEGVSLGTNSSNGSILQALHGSWGAAQGGDFTGGSYATPPTWSSSNTYFWGDCVTNTLKYCAVGDNLTSSSVPGTDWLHWTLMSSVPSPVVQPAVNAVNTSKSSSQGTAFHHITFDCQFVASSGATGLTDLCADFMNFTGQELWVLDRVAIRNPSVAGVWMEDFIPNFGPASGQITYTAPSATACSGSPCDQAAAKVNTADSLNKGLQGAAISTITVAGTNPALATITLSSAPSFTLIRGFMDLVNVGGTGNVSGMTPLAPGVVDETANSHGFWQVTSVESTTVVTAIVPNGTSGCASTCGNYYQFPIGINVNSNSSQNDRGFNSWTLNASNAPATTANTAFSDYPPLAIQVSAGNIPLENNHGEGWRVFTAIGCFGASNGQTIKNSWPNINTHTGFLLCGSFGTPTNFDLENSRCDISGGGHTSALVDLLIDVGNGNTITCANNPVIDYYRTDGGGFAYAQMKTCSEMTKGLCYDGTSLSGYYLAGIRLNGVNPATGIMVFGGTTSGSASIGVAAVAGTPSTLLLPISDGASGQALFSGTPSGGKNQLLWANAVTNASNLANNGVVLGSGGTNGLATVAGITTDGVSKLTLGVAGTSLGAVSFNNLTSGAVTLQPVTGALGTVTASLPANTGTLAELNLAQTWTAAQTFTNSDLLLLGSSTGATTFTSGNSSATNYTATFPANTGTLAELNLAQTWTAAQALGSSTATTQAYADNSTKLATTAFVAAAITGSNPATAVLVATTANLTGTYVQVGGGIGDTFTITATGSTTVDGVTLSATGQPVLLKNQSTASQNGIYTVTVVGTTGVSTVFTRASDYDTVADVNNTGPIFVQSGTANAITSWLLTSQVTSIGSAGSSLNYSQSSSNPANLVLAVSPGAGIAHFAGSTQTVTSSAIVAADITNSTITGTQIASSIALAGSPTTTTQTACDNSTKIATTAYTGVACNTVQTSGSPFALTAQSQTQWNNTSGAYVWDLPATASGIQVCIGNYKTVAHAISLVPPSGSTIYYKGVAGTTSSSTGIVSGGAAGDFICAEGVDSTTWEVIGAGQGTWTNN